MAQAFPVLLATRNSEGEVRWMEVRDWSPSDESLGYCRSSLTGLGEVVLIEQLGGIAQRVWQRRQFFIDAGVAQVNVAAIESFLDARHSDIPALRLERGHFCRRVACPRLTGGQKCPRSDPKGLVLHDDKLLWLEIGDFGP